MDEALDNVQAEPAMPDEQAADLRRLQLAAAAPNAELKQLEDAEEEQQLQQEQSLVDRNTATLSMITELAVPVFRQFGFPTVSDVLAGPHEALEGMSNGQALAVAWAPVLAKYGVDLSNVSDRYKVEIGAVMMTLPVAKALYVAIQVDSGKGRKVRVAAAVQVDAAPAEAPAGPATLGTPAEA